jgi:uroporphyrin-III C-methyltransferase
MSGPDLMSGKVTLVGAGPGAADLLTLRAVDRLRSADVVVFDRLVAPAVLGHAPVGAELIPVGKRPGDSAAGQRRILDLLVAHVSLGRHVVRLKGGDPMVFGRGAEEMQHLVDRGIPVEVVPGVTSAIGVPTSLGIPVTLRGVASSFAVVPGEVAPEDGWAGLAAVDTLVVLMGVRRRTEIASALIASGRRPATPVVFVERGATADERIVTATLDDVAGGRVDVGSPAVWVIGEVVDAVSWRAAERAPASDRIEDDTVRAIA